MTNLNIPKLVNAFKLCGFGMKFKANVDLVEFERLSELVLQKDGVISCELEFKQHNQRNLLITNLVADLTFSCQRCLESIKLNLASQTNYLLVKSAPLSDESEFEVIILADDLELYSLLEDEILLSIPTNITHVDCAMPKFISKADQNIRVNPFAVLAQKF